MGDHADDLINSIFDEDPDREIFEDWVMTSGDGGDLKEVRENFRLAHRLYGDPNYVKCRGCGKERLRWEKIGGRWFLFKGKAIHHCKKKPLPLEILKVLAALRRAEHKLNKLTKKM